MQLTFQPATFVRCIQDTQPDCSLYAYAEKSNNAVPTQIQDWRITQALPVNIVIVDYFNNTDPSPRPLIDIKQAAGGWRHQPLQVPSSSPAAGEGQNSRSSSSGRYLLGVLHALAQAHLAARSRNQPDPGRWTRRPAA